ncbi:MAG: hypothetical protein WBQ08_24470 [Candidatus Sulfotelmatobacter sp.]
MKQKFFRRIAFRGVAFRTVAVLLLGMTGANAMGTADMALPTGPRSERPSADLASQPASSPTSHPARSAGCHSQELPASLPRPVVPATVPQAPRSYQCCVTGHHIAIPFASFSLRLVLACVGDASGAGRFSFLTTAHFPSLVLISPFGSPPGSVSLRI